ncbi:hypothetical protein ALC57_05331 [Trachymyrmex cornetzi]|uniref:Uncharacterized protein n=1 Tax=Trachymyrmex cornetzi TaxID=471704 RepID=A0A151JB67_9HYME|nr:hypothetical protein ALC57_05331 [Trachymyrmex cornetzi]
MSLTLALNGTTSILTASYFPALDLSNGEYELGLTNFETYNAIPNVTSANNKFYFDTDDKIITIPEGSYELSAINRYLRAAIRHVRRQTLNDKGNSDDEYIFDDDDNDNAHKEEILILRANENTMRSEIKCVYRINFTTPNNIGSLLGYSKSRVLQPNKWHASDKPVNIMNVTILRIECNITAGAYNNDKPAHTIHEFAVNVPPGYKLSDTPTHVIYLPVVARNVTDITIRIVDQNGQLINLRGEEISIRLHIRRRR